MTDVRKRFHTDATFHALVTIGAKVFGFNGFADDDGVWHAGPTEADAQKMQAFLDALDANGLRITDRD